MKNKGTEGNANGRRRNGAKTKFIGRKASKR